MDPKMTVVEAAKILKIEGQSVIKKLKNKNFDFKKSKNRVFFGHSTSRQLFSFSNQKCFVASVQIVKGGTGKTALTLNLAIRFCLLGRKVAIIDLDQQANLTTHCKVNAEKKPIMIDIIDGDSNIKESMITVCDGLDLLPSRIDNAVLDDTILFKNLPLDRVYKKQIEILKQHYDVILIDCPPALGRSVGAAALSSDLVLCPVSPDKQCLTGLKLLNDGLEELVKRDFGPKPPYRIVFNKFDGRTTIARELLSILFDKPYYREHMLKTYIRLGQEFVNCCSKSISIYDSLLPSTAKDDVDCLTQELIETFPALQQKTCSVDAQTQENKEIVFT